MAAVEDQERRFDSGLAGRPHHQRPQAETRDSDAVCRVGGDEFLVVLPGATAAEAACVLERCRRNVATGLNLSRSTPIPGAAPAPAGASISVGIVAVPPGLADSTEAVVRLADEALYHSKRSGRDRVHCDVA